tara:strand:+ start:62 stop:490 length:429 start_codon:yes stop_codon:yes gene_type:complete
MQTEQPLLRFRYPPQAGVTAAPNPVMGTHQPPVAAAAARAMVKLAERLETQVDILPLRATREVVGQSRTQVELEVVAQERLARPRTALKRAAMAELVAMLIPRGPRQRAPVCQGIMLAEAAAAVSNPQGVRRQDSLALAAVA